eukprot:scaffold107689_cov27-Prasinocladus_malaysianus.AAC.1
MLMVVVHVFILHLGHLYRYSFYALDVLYARGTARDSYHTLPVRAIKNVVPVLTFSDYSYSYEYHLPEFARDSSSDRSSY